MRYHDAGSPSLIIEYRCQSKETTSYSRCRDYGTAIFDTIASQVYKSMNPLQGPHR